jgi:hypothetical protein
VLSLVSWLLSSGHRVAIERMDFEVTQSVQHIKATHVMVKNRKSGGSRMRVISGFSVPSYDICATSIEGHWCQVSGVRSAPNVHGRVSWYKTSSAALCDKHS